MRWIGIKTLSLTVTSPYEGTLARVARYYLSTGLRMEELEGISHEQALQLYLTHGKTITKAVACAWLNGYWAGKLLTKPLAWYIRWHAQPREILTIMMLICLYGGVSDFMNITRSVRMMKITTPKHELGQEMKGS
ncbi:MAG: hypothetical protein ACXIUD_09800 [Mongoliitalea sp.]